MAKPAKSIPTSPNSPKGPMLSMRATCARVGCAISTGYNSVWSGKGLLAEIPHYKIGRSLRFAESDIDAFLAARRVTPAGR